MDEITVYLVAKADSSSGNFLITGNGTTASPLLNLQTVGNYLGYANYVNRVDYKSNILATKYNVMAISYDSINKKTKYYVNAECLVIKTKIQNKEINYDEIKGITYDYGDLTKFNTKPSQLVLFDKDYKQLLSINNPSIIMVHLIRRKCKHAKVSYYHNKRFLYLLLLINGIVLLISILVKLFS